MHFYAENHRYGIGTTTTIRRAGNELMVSAASLYRFPSRAARDAWVDADPYRDGRPARRATVRKSAMRDHAITRMDWAAWAGYDDGAPETYCGMSPR